MPAVLTHDFFARDAWPQVAAQLGLSGTDQHDAFLLGNQGPDPLFYVKIFPWVEKRNRVGDLMHHAHPAHVLASFREALGMLSAAERPVGQAYVAGFCCHYLLDSTMHPLVFAMEQGICNAGVEGLGPEDHGDVHAEIERDLDEMVLYTKLGQTIKTFRTYAEVLRASDEVLAIIDKLYFYMALWSYNRTLELDTYSHAVKSFRLVQRAFYSPKGRLTGALATVECFGGRKRYSLAKAMSHRVRASADSSFANQDHQSWDDPFTGKASTDSFWDLYEEALSRVFDAEATFLGDGFDIQAAEKLTGGLNFSGMPVDPDSVEEPDE